MQIERDAEEKLRIEVALAVPMIDHPTIARTIVMIRNYKRSAFGTHERGKLGTV